MTTRIGILSDTHLYRCEPAFRKMADLAFRECTIIIHAGDMTDPSILAAFPHQQIWAVHGNMCNQTARAGFPESRREHIDGYTIAICHGAGNRMNIEERLFARFHDVDCIVYGHTHRPVIHQFGDVLFINPGSFQATSPYGSPASYAILETTATGLQARLNKVRFPG
ncbi:MAG: YfcE family phosphodiesterase [Proteobacteria bacterium]|nr:MAG: YfcE family phosphodiesterase [Pseudomonadota bacterium]PIE65266.1 MAG: YfcE family phosphodiesterase [Desulfobacterales bacterium]